MKAVSEGYIFPFDHRIHLVFSTITYYSEFVRMIGDIRHWTLYYTDSSDKWTI